MMITREADYAVRAVVDLALLGRSTAQDLAERQGIPPVLVFRVLRHLRRAGLVRSFRGRQGGVSLSRAPEEISLKDVLEAVEGPIALNLCLTDPPGCERTGTCSVHPVWVAIQARFLSDLSSVTVADLARGRGEAALPRRKVLVRGAEI
jgi:Rrf2 family iron-sulfur cluster assembly transcriptional regulator